MHNRLFEKYLNDLKKDKDKEYIVEINNNSIYSNSDNSETFNNFLQKLEEVSLRTVFKKVVKGEEPDEEEQEMENLKINKGSKLQKINQSFYKTLLNPPDTLDKVKNIDFEEGIEATNRNFILYLWDIGNQKTYNTFFNNLIGKNNLTELNIIEKEDPVKLAKLAMTFLNYVKKWSNFLYNLVKTNLAVINVVVGQKTNIYMKNANINMKQPTTQQNQQGQQNQQSEQPKEQEQQNQTAQQFTQQTQQPQQNQQFTQQNQQFNQQNQQNIEKTNESLEILESIKILDEGIKVLENKYKNNEITKTFYVLQKKYLQNTQKKFFQLLEAIQAENLLKETNEFVQNNVSQLVNEKEVQSAAMLTSYQFVEQFDEILMREITDIPTKFNFSNRAEQFFNDLKNDKNFSKSYYIVYYCTFFLKNLNYLMALINKQKFLITPIVYMAVFEELLKHKFTSVIKNNTLNIGKYLKTIIGTNKKLKKAIADLDIGFFEKMSYDEEDKYYLDKNISVIRNILIHIKKNVVLKNKLTTFTLKEGTKITNEIIAQAKEEINKKISDLLNTIIDVNETVKIGTKTVSKDLISKLYDLIFNYLVEEYIIYISETKDKKIIVNKNKVNDYDIVKYLQQEKILVNYLLEAFKEAKADSKKNSKLELNLVSWLKDE